MTVKHHKPKFLKTSGIELNYNLFAEELAEAKYSLGLLEGSQKNLQNPSLLMSPLAAKEATVSSKIEGTESTVSDVFIYEAGGPPHHSDTAQVANYRRAMYFAIDELGKGRKLSGHIIKSLHGILLQSVRHKGDLGSFRKKSVWIAERQGEPIEKANYVPPEFHVVQDYMDNIITYLEKGKEIILVKTGLIHYQFEAVHPFEDGNGRVGRLLIPLMLFYEKKLSVPILYLSGYFEAHRNEYLHALHEVDTTGVYEHWLKFFFKSVAKQLNETQDLIEKFYHLYNQIKSQFEVTKSPYLAPFIDFLFESPVFTIPQAKKKLECGSALTARKLVKLFSSRKIVVESPIRHGKAKLYIFRQLLDLLS